MRSLTLKLIVAFLAVSLVGTALIAILAGRATANEFGDFVFTQNQDLFATELAEYYLAHGSWDGVNRVMPSRSMPGMGGGGARGMGPGGMMALVDPRGNVVVGGAGHHVGKRLPPNEVDKGVPIEVEDQVVGTLISAASPFRPSPTEGEFLTRVNQVLLWASLGATVVALILGLLLTSALTQPIRELTFATRAVAQGKLGHQVEVRSQDELGELATSFNQMSADLAKSQDVRRQMTADIAHELRTPLSVILGHAEALHDGVLPPTSETFYIIHDEAQRLNRLVEDLRTLSLAEAGELTLARRATSSQFLLERVAAAQSARIQQRKITLDVNVSPQLPDVHVDPDRIAQVLSNLLENALRHTPEGGHITLAAGNYPSGVLLSVHDNGPGINAEDLPRIFDRFYRTDKSRQRNEGGSGLGLAIARSIVDRHDGRIWVESEPGQGSTFFIQLPVADDLA